MLHPHKINHIVISCLSGVFLGIVTSCATEPAQRGVNTTAIQSGKNKPAPSSKTVPGTSKRPDSGLSNPAFKKLKPEVLSYLETLAEAFYTKDTAFLLAQAESYYQRTYEGLYPTDEYLAMLYRIGPYSTESPNGSNKKPSLDIKEVRGITYTGWEELGPVLEVRGTIHLADGKTEICRLILLWHLGDIKIKGIEQ
jgi:hypothetical protein